MITLLKRGLILVNLILVIGSEARVSVLEAPPCIPESEQNYYWFLRDQVNSLGWGDSELNLICAMITTESGWNPNAYNAEVVKVYGLGQLTQWWIRSPALEPFRLTTDYKQRDLFNPEHNILTLLELLRYYHDQCDGDWEAMLSCYSSGQNLKTSSYAKLIIKKANDPYHQLIRKEFTLHEYLNLYYPRD